MLIVTCCYKIVFNEDHVSGPGKEKVSSAYHGFKFQSNSCKMFIRFAPHNS